MTAALLITATLLPLASFCVLVFIGKRMGNPLAGWVATGAMLGSLVCSMAAMVAWLGSGSTMAYMPEPIKWLPIGNGQYLTLGIYIDSLTVAMFSMVTLVSSCVFVFSLGYMAEDPRFPRFFTYLSLFGFSMLGLVIGGTLLQLFVFWELVGLCSYLLIGFWYEKKSASNAAIKAFVTNRIGDFGFLIGLGILFWHFGNVTLPQVWVALDGAGKGGPVTLADGTVFTGTLLTIMGIGLFCGAIGKSAQFPLHVWLPDAMEGPTPVSALIHAATMVAAGVYLTARIFPILTPDAKLFISTIGLVTLTMAALIAVVQSDIKRVLAYSTLSQLGYMILAIGVGSWIGGLFHLITHAFFKALLFLGSGSVIHAAHHEQELPEYGGLMRKLPITAITFGIAVLAIAGTPLFSGFYSKDLILAHAGAFAVWATEKSGSRWYWVFFVVPTCVAYLTAFYMTRCWMLTFWGKPRNPHVYEHAREVPVMWMPLVVLAVFSMIGGSMIGARALIGTSIKESTAYCRTVSPGFDGYAMAWEDPEDLPANLNKTKAEALHHGHKLVMDWVLWAFVAGIGAGFVMYRNGYAVADRLVKIPPLGWLHTWLYRKMYIDELYSVMIIGATMGLTKLCGAFDKYIVDGVVNGSAWIVRRLSSLAGLHDAYVVDGAVNGAATVTRAIGQAARAPQTGRIRVYVTVLLVVVAAGLASAVVVIGYG